MRKLWISFALLFCFSITYSQVKLDWELIGEAKFVDPHLEKHKVSFLLPDTKSPVIKYNPVTLTFSSLMYFYQSVLAVQISAGCSYEISCSNFSKAAIREFGLVKGMALTADRLTRCSQLAAYDIITSDLDFEKQKVKDDLSLYHWHR